MTLYLTFPGEPKAQQSVRFARIGNFIRKYQPKEIVERKNWIRLQAATQIKQTAPDFKIFTGALEIKADFIFALPKSARKAEKQALQAGLKVWKTTRPDLNDNCMKLICDALTEIVWRDDSQICEIHSRKFYGLNPMIAMKISDKQPEGGLFK